jgi:hypothetical protein
VGRGTKILLVVAVALIAIGGYGLFHSGKEKSAPVYSVVKIGLPKLGDIAATSATLVKSYGNVQETISFPGSTSGLAERYVKWFKQNGWVAESENADVNAYRVILKKENVTLTVDFYPRRGTYIQGRRPAAEYDATPK